MHPNIILRLVAEACDVMHSRRTSSVGTLLNTVRHIKYTKLLTRLLLMACLLSHVLFSGSTCTLIPQIIFTCQKYPTLGTRNSTLFLFNFISRHLVASVVHRNHTQQWVLPKTGCCLTMHCTPLNPKHLISIKFEPLLMQSLFQMINPSVCTNQRGIKFL